MNDLDKAKKELEQKYILNLRNKLILELLEAKPDYIVAGVFNISKQLVYNIKNKRSKPLSESN